MPLKQSVYQGATKSATIRVGEDSLTVTFLPSKISPARLKKTAKDNPDLDPNSVYLLSCVTAWDYLDDKDKPLPITSDVLEDLGVDVTNALMDAINAIVNPTRPG